MPQIINTFTTTAILAAVNDTITVGPDGHIITSSVSALYAPNSATSVDISIMGSVIGQSSGIRLGGSSIADVAYNGSNIYVSETGVVGGVSGPGVEIRGGGNSITNFGDIHSFSTAIVLYNTSSSSNSIDNHGTIAGLDNSTAIYITSSFSSLASHYITNTGLITSSLRAISVDDTFLVLNNSGTIQGAADCIRVTGDAYLRLNNSGTINAGSYTAIDLDTSGYASTIKNYGLIIGQVRFSDQNDRLDNGGVIEGSVYLGNGTNYYDDLGTGHVQGIIAGGDSNDTFYISHANQQVSGAGGTDQIYANTSYSLGATVEYLSLTGLEDWAGYGNNLANYVSGNIGDNLIAGRGGDDTLNGREGNDRLLGGAGNDQMIGGFGDDVLRGGIGDDTLYGEGGTITASHGDDKLHGGDGADTLYGGVGDDRLVGGAGDDDLSGGKGADVLIGGYGQDVMRGQGGDDRFLFKSVQETSAVKADSDRIIGFQQGSDLIDLSRMLGKKFDYEGTSGLSGGGDAEIALNISGGNTFVQIDVNGDGVIDGQIKIVGVTGLLETDFIL